MRVRELHAPRARQIGLVDIPGCDVLLGGAHLRQESLGIVFTRRCEARRLLNVWR
jgi:hypothetical protein